MEQADGLIRRTAAAAAAAETTPTLTLTPPAAAPRPLDATTNGHSTGSEQISASEYPSSSSEEEGDDGKDDSRRYRKSIRASLRHWKPRQLVDGLQEREEWHLFLFLLLFRGTTALITSRTVFAPDEHWQSLEIAHKMVFGSGYTTWEWRDTRTNVNADQGWASGPIRSPLYPILFTVPYWVLHWLKLDHTGLLIALPSILQAILAAVTDLYTFKLARKLLNDRSAWITLLPTLFSLYTFHTSTRTLSNSTEAAFTILAFYHWPLSLPQDSDSDLVGEMPLIEAASLERSLIFFAMSSILRPSNILLSLSLIGSLVLRITRNVKSASTALESAFALIVVGRACLVIGIASVALLTTVDSLYYGRLTFTPVAFFKRNVLEGISLFYGRSPLHFYFTSALPFICFTSLPYTLYGLALALGKPDLEGFDGNTRKWYGKRGENDPGGLQLMAQVAVFFVVSMSVLGHKEVRFLQPIVPLLHILEGYALSMLPSLNSVWKDKVRTRRRRRRKRETGGGSSNEERSAPSSFDREASEIRRIASAEREARNDLLDALSSHVSSRNRRHILPKSSRLFSLAIPSRLAQSWQDIAHRHGKTAMWLLGAHVLPIVYVSFHSAGQVAIAEEVGRLSRAGQVRDQVGFLMPCHSTPWMSHMHDKRLEQTAWFITCEPPLDGQDMATYKDESDYFYDDPYLFIHRMLSHSSSSPPPPSHLALFEALLGVKEQQGQKKQTVGDLLAANGFTIHKSFWNSFFHLDHRRRGPVLLMAKP